MKTFNRFNLISSSVQQITVAMALSAVNMALAPYASAAPGTLYETPNLTSSGQQTDIASISNAKPWAPQSFTSHKLQSENAEPVRFDTSFFTFNDITTFAYLDNTELSLRDTDDNELSSVTLNATQQHTDTLFPGVYQLSGNLPYTTLVGDAISGSVQGFYAVDQSGRGLSTLLNTYMVKRAFGAEKFIVFAYEDNTEFTIRNLETQELIYAGAINRGQHLELPQPVFNTYLQVSSNKPVSALSYGDQDYYVPSDNGTFTGTTFFGYSAYIGNWTNSVTVTAYQAATNVTITHSETGVELASFSLDESQVFTLPIRQPTYWTVTANHPVTVSNTPFAGYTQSYYYMTRAIDQSGSGAGTLFYVPSIASRIDVFSFADDNKIKITRLGSYDQFPYETPIAVTLTDREADADGYYPLNKGEAATFTSSVGRYVYKVESTSPVSVLQSNGGAGSDFMPLNYALDKPDLTISSQDISFSKPLETLNAGDTVEVSVTINNVGYATADDVMVKVYDGKPDDGIVPTIAELFTGSIDQLSSQTVTFTYSVPDSPAFKSLYFRVASASSVESNPSNNLVEKPLLARQDREPPLTVSLDAPGGLTLDGDQATTDPFTIHLDLFNVSIQNEEDVIITLQLMEGLGLVDGEEQEIDLAALFAGDKVTVDWKVVADPNYSGTNRYQITIQHGDNEKSVYRSINVPDAIAPSAPINLSLKVNAEGQVVLEWDDGNEYDLAGFEIYEKIAGEYVKLAVIPALNRIALENATSSSNTFAVRAFDSSNNLSAFVEITPTEDNNDNTDRSSDGDNRGKSGGVIGFPALVFLMFVALRRKYSGKFQA